MRNKKTILIIAGSPFLSGAELSLLQFLKYVDRRNFNFVLALSPKNNEIIERCKEFTIILIPFGWFNKSNNPLRTLCNFINLIYCTFRIVKIIKSKNVDIIYSNTIKSHLFGVCAKLLTGKKNIWHVRDNIKKGWINSFLIRNTDMFICISHHIYNQIEVSADKKELISIGLDEEQCYYTVGKNIREKLNLNDTTRVIAQIGQIVPWKNYEDYIRVAEILQKEVGNIFFLIVGDDMSGTNLKYKNSIKTMIRKAGLEKSLVWLGFVKDINNIYLQIDILVHTAINEPFGRVVLEATVMGRPVVAYNCGGVKEIVINNKTGFLVEPKNYKAMAEKIKVLLLNDELRSQFGYEGRLTSLTSFNSMANAPRYHEIFDQLCPQ